MKSKLPLSCTTISGLVAARSGVTEMFETVGAVPEVEEVTLKVRELLVPPGVVTVTERDPVVAVAEMTTLHVTWLAVDWIPETVTPALELKLTPVAPLKFEPEMVRFVVVPCFPLVGLMEVIDGAVVVAALTVKERVLLAPPGPETDTVRAPVAALDDITTLQVTWVAVAWMPETLIPVLGVKLIELTPVKFEPWMLKLTVEP